MREKNESKVTNGIKNRPTFLILSRVGDFSMPLFFSILWINKVYRVKTCCKYC